MKLLLSKVVDGIILITMFSGPVRAQFLMDMIDTTTEMGKGMLSHI